ncbi:MAG: endonuclease III [Anaerolineaceae bacterium]|nr:endonuclease III [Anaerolineaceae bacterium]
MTTPLFPDEDLVRTREIMARVQPILDEMGERTTVQLFRGQPFPVLISSLLSARTREEDTKTAMDHLFALADNPADMAKLAYEDVLKAIDAVQYPGNKAEYILKTSALVAEQGRVPDTLDELMALPGIGWKSAVLVLWLAFGLAPEICVDVHVARIGKRLGLVNTSTKQPQKVSQELMTKVPKEIWGPWNPMMVNFGRTICLPTYPKCPTCPINDLCPKVGVKGITR